MANLTVTIDPEVLKRARIRALEQGTSVNKLVARYLEQYVEADAAARKERANRELAEIADRLKLSSDGRKWSREELYDRGR